MFQLDLISNAYAESGGTEAAMGNIIFMVLLFAIFYFLLIRPQQKQAKQHKEMIANLQRGDKVVTGGGIVGKIHRVDDDMLVLDVGEVEVGDKSFRPVRLRVKRGTVAAVDMKAGIDSDEKASEAAEKSDK